MAQSAILPLFDYSVRLPGGMRFPARMSALPLADRKLALVSPGPIDGALAARLEEHGEVTLLIAPNLLHYMHLTKAAERFPAARVLAPAGLSKKLPGLRIDGTLEHDVPALLSDSVDVLKFEGAPALEEFVFFHRSQRTLVVTDLVFNIQRPQGVMLNLLLALVGCRGRLAQSRALRFMIRDRSAARASIERILKFDFETLVVAHGEVVTTDARAELTNALRWLLPARAALPALP